MKKAREKKNKLKLERNLTDALSNVRKVKYTRIGGDMKMVREKTDNAQSTARTAKKATTVDQRLKIHKKITKILSSVLAGKYAKMGEGIKKLNEKTNIYRKMSNALVNARDGKGALASTRRLRIDKKLVKALSNMATVQGVTIGKGMKKVSEETNNAQATARAAKKTTTNNRRQEDAKAITEALSSVRAAQNTHIGKGMKKLSQKTSEDLATARAALKRKRTLKLAQELVKAVSDIQAPTIARIGKGIQEAEKRTKTLATAPGGGAHRSKRRLKLDEKIVKALSNVSTKNGVTIGKDMKKLSEKTSEVLATARAVLKRNHILEPDQESAKTASNVRTLAHTRIGKAMNESETRSKISAAPRVRTGALTNKRRQELDKKLVKALSDVATVHGATIGNDMKKVTEKTNTAMATARAAKEATTRKHGLVFGKNLTKAISKVAKIKIAKIDKSMNKVKAEASKALVTSRAAKEESERTIKVLAAAGTEKQTLTHQDKLKLSKKLAQASSDIRTAKDAGIGKDIEKVSEKTNTARRTVAALKKALLREPRLTLARRYAKAMNKLRKRKVSKKTRNRLATARAAISRTRTSSKPQIHAKVREKASKAGRTSDAAHGTPAPKHGEKLTKWYAKALTKLSKKTSTAGRSAQAAKVGVTKKRLLTLDRKLATSISSVETSNAAEITKSKNVGGKISAALSAVSRAKQANHEKRKQKSGEIRGAPVRKLGVILAKTYAKALDKLSEKTSTARRSAQAAKVGLTKKRLLTLDRKLATSISSVETSNAAEITKSKNVGDKISAALSTVSFAKQSNNETRKQKSSEICGKPISNVQASVGSKIVTDMERRLMKARAATSRKGKTSQSQIENTISKSSNVPAAEVPKISQDKVDEETLKALVSAPAANGPLKHDSRMQLVNKVGEILPNLALETNPDIGKRMKKASRTTNKAMAIAQGSRDVTSEKHHLELDRNLTEALLTCQPASRGNGMKKVKEKMRRAFVTARVTRATAKESREGVSKNASDGLSDVDEAKASSIGYGINQVGGKTKNALVKAQTVEQAATKRHRQKLGNSERRRLLSEKRRKPLETAPTAKVALEEDLKSLSDEASKVPATARAIKEMAATKLREELRKTIAKALSDIQAAKNGRIGDDVKKLSEKTSEALSAARAAKSWNHETSEGLTTALANAKAIRNKRKLQVGKTVSKALSNVDAARVARINKAVKMVREERLAARARVLAYSEKKPGVDRRSDC
eukprot:TRINITY_DN2481_c0_g1_i1.p1 TRINITY_DN2481_c0_g1~~TRINITY_DN2481_c0_g1_i1.p1  ORF type:complete len:1239 (-),score=247.77 TRINITY_DN2481_c0_g1_i1:39-3755(-)